MDQCRHIARVAVAASLLLPTAAWSDLLEYRFQATDGEHKALSPESRYASPSGLIDFALAGGLERRLKLKVLNPSGEVY